MYFAWDITITADTPEASPKTQTLKLTRGVVTHIGIKFPSGCHGLVKVRLLRWETQLIPLSRGEWVTGDDEEVKTDMYYEMEELPSSLKFIGCSPTTQYNHTVTVRVTILPKAMASMMPIIELFTKLLKRLLGGV